MFYFTSRMYLFNSIHVPSVAQVLLLFRLHRRSADDLKEAASQYSTGTRSNKEIEIQIHMTHIMYPSVENV
jgi:hypothetical protein